MSQSWIAEKLNLKSAANANQQIRKFESRAIESLLNDVAALRLSAAERLPHVVPFAGKRHRPEFQNVTDRLARNFFLAGNYAHAETLFRAGRPYWQTDGDLLAARMVRRTKASPPAAASLRVAPRRFTKL